MFNQLHSTANQELYEKHLCNQSGHYEKYKWHHPCLSIIEWKVKYPLRFVVSYDYVAVQIKNFWKAPKLATLKNMDNLCYTKEAITWYHQINTFCC